MSPAFFLRFFVSVITTCALHNAFVKPFKLCFMQMSLTVEERLDRIEQLLRGQKNVLNFSEACDFTGISPSYMYKLTHNARIPHYKPHGKNVYFLREELEQWLLQNPVRTAEQKDREATEFVLRKRRPR